uniref:Alternative protein CADPS2 n=1 Tax=Homo sapiens TaxID=9606 RepID=L8E9J4_HUMAN|nr:alternative protein CADPS2 [Homo sapiens]
MTHFCVMENFTNTCKKSLYPWLSAMWISWSLPSPSQFTEVLSRRHGSLSTMAQQHQKTFFGSLMHCKCLSLICTGQNRNLPTT